MWNTGERMAHGFTDADIEALVKCGHTYLFETARTTPDIQLMAACSHAMWKRDKGDFGKPLMVVRADAATSAQKRFLRGLGYTGRVKDKEQASRLIEALKRIKEV